MTLTRNAQVGISRSIDELRRGYPIVVSSAESIRLVASPETCTTPQFFLKNDGFCVLLGKSRAKFFLGFKPDYDVRIAVGSNTSMESIISLTLSNICHCGWQHSIADAVDSAVLNLLGASGLLPCAMILDITQSTLREINAKIGFDLLCIEAENIRKFRHNHEVQEICSTPVTFRSASDGEVIVYRNNGKDHLAVLIGDPTNNPLVRIHSSCYTGDILRVLTCDCGDQLRTTIDIMLNAGGGIILYLNQEGRGIGLVNKFRAYNMQSSHKMDTITANEILGFEADERSFELAASILAQLEIKKLRLITNNPNKVEALKQQGLEVTERVKIICDHNMYNARYMHTKFTKLGHLDR